ncbi:MAG: hypothetical protein KGS09_11215 [Nitrospirae bacterium]|nr:hypothetical protein [Nitrospirota bacterium]
MASRPRQGTALFLVHAILSAFTLSGCASVDVLMLSGETFSPRTTVSDVEVLEQEPTRPHIQIAELSVDSLWLSIASKRQKILEKAAMLGADAVVFSEPETPPLAQGNRAVGQSNPPNWSAPKDVDRLMSNGLRSAAHDDIVHSDVRIVLIRGGGHGGGHGHGGGGHWGGMRGRSGPSAARPWGRHYAPYYGPRYWGYGLYGPGGWGYAPYWGGYDPLWGSYAPYPLGGYPGFGSVFMNTVTIGTAIHYTDSP